MSNAKRVRAPGGDVLVRDCHDVIHRLACNRSVRRWNYERAEFEIIDASRALVGDIIATLGGDAIAGEVVG